MSQFFILSCGSLSIKKRLYFYLTPFRYFSDPSCELCGFFFENRKALASHARAHLRQFGVTEWSVNGSPIETLSAWMRSRPQKVLEMHRSYMQGNRSTFKKVRQSIAALVIHLSVKMQASAAVLFGLVFFINSAISDFTCLDHWPRDTSAKSNVASVNVFFFLSSQ